jgi:hypothetical protein
MVSPQKIKYNGIFSDTGLGVLDIILDVAFDSDNGVMSSYLNRSAVASESHDGRYKNTTRYKYDELFSPQFTIVKKDFSDFTQEEVRKVLKYLTSTDKPALLEVYYDGASNVVDWACIGGWISIETYKLANNRTVGIIAQFEAITPYAMSRLYSTEPKTITSKDNKITINIDTDDNKPVYPRVTIQTNGNDIKFINKHTDFFNVSTSHNSLVITNNASDEIVTVDGANQIIKTSLTRRTFGDHFNWAWLELYDGKNEITIEGNCVVTIEYREVRKVGEY